MDIGGSRSGTRPPGTLPDAAILFDKFHIMSHLGERSTSAQERIRPLDGAETSVIKGQKYTLLSNREKI